MSYEISKQELLKLFEKLYFNEEITINDLEKIILNIKTLDELYALQIMFERKYSCSDMEAGAYMSMLHKMYEKEV